MAAGAIRRFNRILIRQRAFGDRRNPPESFTDDELNDTSQIVNNLWRIQPQDTVLKWPCHNDKAFNLPWLKIKSSQLQVKLQLNVLWKTNIIFSIFISYFSRDSNIVMKHLCLDRLGLSTIKMSKSNCWMLDLSINTLGPRRDQS